MIEMQTLQERGIVLKGLNEVENSPPTMTRSSLVQGRQACQSAFHLASRLPYRSI